ncbi:MAG: YdbL family protein [Sphingomonas sp.]|nr:YdbL family protein [Sphingomonas sp.]
MRTWILAVAIGGAAAAIPAEAPSQSYSALAAARQAGQVGERYDGYLGLATPSSAAVQRQVSAINIRRRSLYLELARRRGVTPQVAALATGCELITRVQVGEVYLLQDGVWRRRQPGQVIAQPSYCG